MTCTMESAATCSAIAQTQEGGAAELKEDYSEGKVTAAFDWVQRTSQRSSGSGTTKLPETARIPAVPEGCVTMDAAAAPSDQPRSVRSEGSRDPCRKKFFLAPSLCTKAGKKRTVNMEWCAACCAILNVRCHLMLG